MKTLLLLSLLFFAASFHAQEEGEEVPDVPASSLKLSATKYTMTVSAPSDGELDDEQYGEGSEMIQSTETQAVEEKEIYWCYDCCQLLRITYEGSAEHVTIVYTNIADEISQTILEDFSFQGKITIKASDFMGGTISIQDLKGTYLHDIKIVYDGCY